MKFINFGWIRFHQYNPSRDKSGFEHEGQMDLQRTEVNPSLALDRACLDYCDNELARSFVFKNCTTKSEFQTE